mgnify:CR=1 FL=1
MANLSVNYCGVNYRNPLVLASATPGWDGEAMRLAGEAGIGGVIPKLSLIHISEPTRH